MKAESVKTAYAALATALALSAASGATAEVLRTSWGVPDLDGVWTTATATPLERPEALTGKERLSETEAAQVEAATDRRYASFDAPPRPGSVGGYNRAWLDPGLRVLADRRTSLIVDPPDGRIPWRPESREAAAREAARYGVGPYETYVDLDTGERCISDGVTMAPLQPYNMNFRIVQTPDYVLILQEMYHEYRIVPLDGRPRTSPGQWLGEARGRWDGDTLVIETERFIDRPGYHWAWLWRAARPTLRVTERLTRVDAETIDYRFTIEDPLMFTRAWTAAVPMTTDQASRGVTAGRLYEYACHEGNYALPNVLSGAAASRRGGEAKPPAGP